MRHEMEVKADELSDILAHFAIDIGYKCDAERFNEMLYRYTRILLREVEEVRPPVGDRYLKYDMGEVR